MNKKGFTLIELLAVIIILGILMIIAIPSVTKYINDSRKNAYVDSAKEIIGSARNLVNSGELEMYDTDATYYLDVNCINTENALKSPYGEFKKAYVVITYDGKGYNYYFTSVDDAGQGIKEIIKYDKLDIDDIESDLNESNISTERGIDAREKTILITKENNCKKSEPSNATEYISANGTNTGAVMYPRGRDEDTLEIGDIVKIGTEEFYVISNDSEELKLFAKYNLKVGYNCDTITRKVNAISPSEPGYGLQSSEMRGYDPDYYLYTGTIAFSDTDYWTGKLGTTYPNVSGEYYYVYDSNSILYQHLENYKTYLEGFGVSPDMTIFELRDLAEFFQAGFSNEMFSTSYWTGNFSNYNPESGIISFNQLSSYPYKNGFASYYDKYTNGIRPGLIIKHN